MNELSHIHIADLIAASTGKSVIQAFLSRHLLKIIGYLTVIFIERIRGSIDGAELIGWESPHSCEWIDAHVEKTNTDDGLEIFMVVYDTKPVNYDVDLYYVNAK